jgi:hypothetical protein
LRVLSLTDEARSIIDFALRCRSSEVISEGEAQKLLCHPAEIMAENEAKKTKETYRSGPVTHDGRKLSARNEQGFH